MFYYIACMIQAFLVAFSTHKVAVCTMVGVSLNQWINKRLEELGRIEERLLGIDPFCNTSINVGGLVSFRSRLLGAFQYTCKRKGRIIERNRYFSQ